ncbi:MAG TPA: hypothetical protein VKY85_07825 [Candidatus Angelobacter sp.]|nr:hypothetical protein [Candidatus Angelobacter sp.]
MFNGLLIEDLVAHVAEVMERPENEWEEIPEKRSMPADTERAGNA